MLSAPGGAAGAAGAASQAALGPAEIEQGLYFSSLEQGISYGEAVKSGLISDARGRIIAVHEGWAICPDCGRGRLMPIHPATQGRMIPAWCKRCRRQHFLNIDASACADVPEPERME